ncbi:T9SS type A sorting domain-containing protein [Flavobacterium sp. UMI-01]|uniref:T9SS type A sorting domain-containing protein n=1 Tax=Flavobacterium sp. UMI-01 TaxID=1441053 RepID=UPI001C7C9FC9|nr:T9SS type A sorting domain-containing protein [Flavobacterium sp. UMI-01]GIZ09508.1 hypothetical protein FUMI01_22350 [Flavobacterium sp. UMI-01]
MKRKLQFLSVVAMTAFLGMQTVNAQIALPGVIEAETGGTYTTGISANANFTGGTANGISGFNNSGSPVVTRTATYTVTVATAGIYDISMIYGFASGSAATNAGLRVYIPAGETTSLPSTDQYNVFGGAGVLRVNPTTGTNYTTAAPGTFVKNGFYLPSGTYKLSFENVGSGGYSIDKWEILSSTAPRPFPNVGTVPNITTTGTNEFEAENYDQGGQGVTFFDTTLANTGTATAVAYRIDNVDVSNAAGVGSPSNANVVNAIADTEWMEYTVNIVNDGNYKLATTYASGSDTGLKLTAAIYNSTGTKISDLITTPLELTTTTSATTYVALTSPAFPITTTGSKIIRISFSDGTGSGVNIDKFKLVYDSTLGVNDFESNVSINVHPNPSASGVFQLGESVKWEVYSALGSKVAQGEGTEINLSSQAKGVYLVKTAKGATKVVFQ